jgi:pre-60S factor REI1
VYNLKRRIASLPSISRIVYDERVVGIDSGSESTDEPWPAEKRDTNRHTKTSHGKARSRTPKPTDDQDGEPASNTSTLIDPEHSEKASSEEDFNSLQCLFCNAESISLDSNLSHMGHDHGFFIPDAEDLFDIESFLGYLFILISQFHECLYCGSIRNSKLATQDHMRGKGHCKIDFENDEHDLIQFYDIDDEVDEDGNRSRGKFLPVPDEDDELRLPSGKTLGHRSHTQTSRRRRTDRGSPGEPSRKLLSNEADSKEGDNEEDSEPVPTLSNDRRLAMRAGTSTSMIGIPEVQQRALIAVERQMLTVKNRQKNAYESKVDKGGNQQKTFRVKSIGKKAGGLEKRLG